MGALPDGPAAAAVGEGAGRHGERGGGTALGEGILGTRGPGEVGGRGPRRERAPSGPAFLQLTDAPSRVPESRGGSRGFLGLQRMVGAQRRHGSSQGICQPGKGLFSGL